MFFSAKEFFFENTYELLGVKELLGISTIDPRMSSNVSLSELSQEAGSDDEIVILKSRSVILLLSPIRLILSQ